MPNTQPPGTMKHVCIKFVVDTKYARDFNFDLQEWVKHFPHAYIGGNPIISAELVNPIECE